MTLTTNLATNLTTKRILFLDQSSGLGGAELCLLDIASDYAETGCVGLFSDGDFRKALEQRSIPYQLLTTGVLNIHKNSSFLESLASILNILSLIWQVTKVSRGYDLIYANTQKAFVIGSIASALGRRPLIYHLHDILSIEHFSKTNLRIAINLANRFATRVIANSEATRQAFVEAGGKANIVSVVYNGFHPSNYNISKESRLLLRQSLGLEKKFVVGCFSRLSPWKGQHILLEALAKCSPSVMVLFVGDALYGEDDYVKQLHQQIHALQLNDRVKFLGFRSDVPELMQACDVIAHTSVTPEPFGRVIVEAMLSRRPIIATAAGGAVELVLPEKTGWLVQPKNPMDLVHAIESIQQNPKLTESVVQCAYMQAIERFHIETVNREIYASLHSL